MPSPRELFGNTSPLRPAPDVWPLRHPVLASPAWVVILLLIFVPLVDSVRPLPYTESTRCCPIGRSWPTAQTPMDLVAGHRPRGLRYTSTRAPTCVAWRALRRSP
ncbi:hypothetical protein ACSHWB_35120 [Lentzea sp. HUAS TT2]|uniref:hypothetical protein n=1 Tax=Lentzea sp. HUAS TT2 TaxID=3447454 RepID=UPI003F7014D2